MKHSKTKDTILELFFDNPSKNYHLRELARESNISVSAVSRAVKSLEKENLLVLHKKVVLEVKAKIDSKFRNLKRVHNLKKIYERGLYDYLSKKYPFHLIILFGSYSLGEDIENSDIDIYVDSKMEVDLSNFENIYKRKINLEAKSYKNITNSMKKTLINGIVLNGVIQ